MIELSRDGFLERVARRREGLGFLKYDDHGRTVSNCGKQQLSPGCQSCKEGRWICVFPSHRCNASCAFCPQSRTERKPGPETVDRSWLDSFLSLFDARAAQVTGLSISGGELFMNWEAATRIVKHVSEKHPHVYTWAYTNGIAASRDKLRELRDLGLREIRFNLAATRFHAAILRKVDDAVRLFPWVSVEVPSCEQTYHHLVDEEALLRIAGMGVRQLNLAELLVPDYPSNATTTYDPEEHALYRFPSVMGDMISPVSSRLLTYGVFEYAEKKGIGIRINDCSNEAKQLQQEARAAASDLAGLAAAARPEARRRVLARHLRDLRPLLDRLESALTSEEPLAALEALAGPTLLEVLFEIEACRLVRMGPELAPLLRRLLAAGRDAAAAGLLPPATVAALRRLLARLAKKLRLAGAWDQEAPLWWEPLPRRRGAEELWGTNGPPVPPGGTDETVAWVRASGATPVPLLAEPSLAEMLLRIEKPRLPAGTLLLHELRDDEPAGRFHVRRAGEGSGLRIGLVTTVAPEARSSTTTRGAGRRLDLWCRYHLERGVAHLVVVFDRPEDEDEAATRLRAAHPPERLTLWSGARLARERWPQLAGLAAAGLLPELARPSSQAARQALNASVALAAAGTDELGGARLDWLLHLDDDELWAPTGPPRGGASLPEHLAAAAGTGYKLVRYVNHELLLPTGPEGPRFKVNPHLARARLGPQGWTALCEQLAMRASDRRPYFHGDVNGKAAVAVAAGVAAAGVHGWHLAEPSADASIWVNGPVVLHMRPPTADSFFDPAEIELLTAAGLIVAG